MTFVLLRRRNGLLWLALLPFVLSAQSFHPIIPKTWDDAEMATMEVPLSSAAASPMHVSADYYYRLPVQPIYKSYRIYAPGREPEGYWQSLQQREPEVTFNVAQLRTEQDWLRAGELVFAAPILYDVIVSPAMVRDPAWYQKTGVRVLPDGTLPYLRYFVRQKGKVEVGNLSCASCHTRVMRDGSVISGAQGNFPFDRAFAYSLRPPAPPELVRNLAMGLYGAPWLKQEVVGELNKLPLEQIITALARAGPPWHTGATSQQLRESRTGAGPDRGERSQVLGSHRTTNPSGHRRSDALRRAESGWT